MHLPYAMYLIKLHIPGRKDACDQQGVKMGAEKERKRSALVSSIKQEIYGFEDGNLMFFQAGFAERRPGVFTRIYQLPVTEVNFIQRRRDMPRGTHGTINSWWVECIFGLNARKSHDLPEGLQSILVGPALHVGLFISPATALKLSVHFFFFFFFL